MDKDTIFKFGTRTIRDSPDMTADKCFRKVGVVTWLGSREFVNFWALSANGPKWSKLWILRICVSVNKATIANQI